MSSKTVAKPDESGIISGERITNPDGKEAKVFAKKYYKEVGLFNTDC
jgi:hypothetical protein